MKNEQLRMQMLSGIITEGQYKAKLEENKKPKSKKSLKENFVGMGAINNPFICYEILIIPKRGFQKLNFRLYKNLS